MQPNILLIVTDQEYAHPQLPAGYRLRNHERLKARGVSFDNFQATTSVEALLANNDVALYDLVTDPHEMVNLARPDHPDYDEALLAEMNGKLNRLISAEIGEDRCPYGF